MNESAGFGILAALSGLLLLGACAPVCHQMKPVWEPAIEFEVARCGDARPWTWNGWRPVDYEKDLLTK